MCVEEITVWGQENMLEIVAIVISIIALIITIWSVRWGKLYKIHPKLLLMFRRRYVWNPFIEDSDKKSWYEEHKDVLEKYEKHDILSIRPPSDVDISYSTNKYEWHYSFPPFNDFNRPDREYPYKRLDYHQGMLYKGGCGPWYIYLNENKDKDLEQKRLEKIGKVWWIFYFKDDYRGKNHCYCNSFKLANGQWNEIHDQKSCHYGLIYDTDNDDCKSCYFKKYIKEPNNSKI